MDSELLAGVAHKGLRAVLAKVEVRRRGCCRLRSGLLMEGSTVGRCGVGNGKLLGGE